MLGQFSTPALGYNFPVSGDGKSKRGALMSRKSEQKKTHWRVRSESTLHARGVGNQRNRLPNPKRYGMRPLKMQKNAHRLTVRKAEVTKWGKGGGGTKRLS